MLRPVNALDDWIGDHLAPALRERGFAGGPRLFRRRSGNVRSLIQAQVSAYNDVGPTRFRINYGIVHDGVTYVLSGRLPGRGFEINFGQKVPVSDSWWTLEPARVRHDTLASTVAAALDREVLPFLDRYGTDAGYRDYLFGLPADVAAPYIRALDDLERGREPTA
jgi:hypothetical protein